MMLMAQWFGELSEFPKVSNDGHSKFLFLNVFRVLRKSKILSYYRVILYSVLGWLVEVNKYLIKTASICV